MSTQTVKLYLQVVTLPVLRTFGSGLYKSFSPFQELPGRLHSDILLLNYCLVSLPLHLPLGL